MKVKRQTRLLYKIIRRTADGATLILVLAAALFAARAL
jgi:hypothetical protein